MKKHQDIIFVDGFTNLSYSAGAFRFDLSAITPATIQSNDPSKLNAEVQAHVIMTPQAFIQAIKAMENFVTQVKEKGIIRFGEQADMDAKAESLH